MKFLLFIFCLIYCLCGFAGQFYLQAQTGYGGMDTPSINQTPPNTSEATAIVENTASSQVKNNNAYGLSYRAALGFLWAKQQMRYGLELGYNGYGDNSYSSHTSVNGINTFNQQLRYQSYLFDLLAVGKYYFAKQWNAFAKAGAALVFQNVVNNIDATAVSNDSLSVLPEISVGVGYDLTQHWAVNISLRYALGSNTNISSLTTKAYTTAAGQTVPEVLITGSNNKIPAIFSAMLGFRYSI